MTTIGGMLNQIFNKVKLISDEELPTQRTDCPYCKGHKKFAVMDGYFALRVALN